MQATKHRIAETPELPNAHSMCTHHSQHSDTIPSKSKDTMPIIKDDLVVAIRELLADPEQLWVSSWGTKTRLAPLQVIWRNLHNRLPLSQWTPTWSDEIKTQTMKNFIVKRVNARFSDGSQVDTRFSVNAPLSVEGMVDTLITTTLPRMRQECVLNGYDKDFRPILKRMVEEAINRTWEKWIAELNTFATNGSIENDESLVGTDGQEGIYNLVELAAIVDIYQKADRDNPNYKMSGLWGNLKKPLHNAFTVRQERLGWMNQLPRKDLTQWLSDHKKDLTQNPNQILTDRLDERFAQLFALRKKVSSVYNTLHNYFKPSLSPGLNESTIEMYTPHTLANALKHRREAVIELLNVISMPSFRQQFPSDEKDVLTFVGGPHFEKMALGPVDTWYYSDESFNTNRFRDAIIRILFAMHESTDYTDEKFRYLDIQTMRGLHRKRGYSLLDYVLFWLVCPGDMRRFQNNVNFLKDCNEDTTYGASNSDLYDFALRKYEDVYNPKPAPSFGRQPRPGTDPLPTPKVVRAEIAPDAKVLYIMNTVSNGRAYTPMRSMRKLIREFAFVPDTGTSRAIDIILRKNASETMQQQFDHPTVHLPSAVDTDVEQPDSAATMPTVTDNHVDPQSAVHLPSAVDTDDETETDVETDAAPPDSKAAMPTVKRDIVVDIIKMIDNRKTWTDDWTNRTPLPSLQVIWSNLHIGRPLIQWPEDWSKNISGKMKAYIEEGVNARVAAGPTVDAPVSGDELLNPLPHPTE